MAEFEFVTKYKLDDDSAGIAGVSRHQYRLHEVMPQIMVELTARQRMHRALNSKTREPTTSPISLALKLPKLGDQVEFYRLPATKNESGWRRPAVITQAGPPTVIRWQDQLIQVSTQDLKKALSY